MARGQRTLRSLARVAVCASTLAFATACKDDVVDPDPGPKVTYDEWIKYEPAGAECADGTQYKYFVKYRENAENVLVLFEGGGACWNWETCTAAAGSLGALGVDCVMNHHNGGTEDCIRDNYADTYFNLPSTVQDDMLGLVKKLLPDYMFLTDRYVSIDTAVPVASAGRMGRKRDGDFISPMHDWNLVFVPYCTSDLYTGNNVAKYVNPEDPNDVVTFKHVGLKNALIVAEELNELFPTVPNFAMNGCSAGGAGVMANYYFFRTRMKGIQQGFVFSDAGPFFPTHQENAHSLPLHNAVREAWNAESVFDLLIQERSDILPAQPVHVAEIYPALSRAFPNDRFSIAHTQTDFNYSLYSYTSFHGLETRARNPEDAKKIYEYWKEDNDALVDYIEPLENFSYYMPFWRKTNDSHCISLLGFEDAGDDELASITKIVGDGTHSYAGTEITEDGTTYTYRDHLFQVLDLTKPPMSIFELDGEGPRVHCTPDYYDEALCGCVFNLPSVEECKCITGVTPAEECE